MTSTSRITPAVVRSLLLKSLLGSLLVATVFSSGCLPRRPYDACSVNADCPGGTTCQQITAMGDRICTTSCATPANCPLDRYGTSARCISFDGGSNFSCWQACAAGAGGGECPAGYGCFTEDATGRVFDPICLPDRGSTVTATQRAYENCSSSSQCRDFLACTSINGVGMCTDVCTDPLDCPLDIYGTSARCISFGGAAATCFQACNVSAGGAECETGWGCFNSDGVSSFPPICLPR